MAEARLAVKIRLFYFSLAGVYQTIHARRDVNFRLFRGSEIVVPMMAGGEGRCGFAPNTETITAIKIKRLFVHFVFAPKHRE